MVPARAGLTHLAVHCSAGSVAASPRARLHQRLPCLRPVAVQILETQNAIRGQRDCIVGHSRRGACRLRALVTPQATNAVATRSAGMLAAAVFVEAARRTLAVQRHWAEEQNHQAVDDATNFAEHYE